MSYKDYSEDLFKAMEQLINAKMSNMKFKFRNNGNLLKMIFIIEKT